MSAQQRVRSSSETASRVSQLEAWREPQASASYTIITTSRHPPYKHTTNHRKSQLHHRPQINSSSATTYNRLTSSATTAPPLPPTHRKHEPRICRLGQGKIDLIINLQAFKLTNTFSLPQPRDDVYGAYNPSYLPQSQGGTQGPISHTQSPIVTGTSVLAIKYKDGVVLAADNLASYGSLARFTDVKRLKQFNRKAVVGFGGDVSDMQYLDRLLKSLDVEENYDASSDATAAERDPHMSAKNLHAYLSKVMYKRRSDFNPLWNAMLVAGLDEAEKPFLAYADLLGTTYSSPSLATGFGAHLAQPIMRRVVPNEAASRELSKEQAVETIKECMKVLFYRDARSMPLYSIAVIDGSGVDLKEDEKLENQSWAFAEQIRGYGTQTV